MVSHGMGWYGMLCHAMVWPSILQCGMARPQYGVGHGDTHLWYVAFRSSDVLSLGINVEALVGMQRFANGMFPNWFGTGGCAARDQSA